MPEPTVIEPVQTTSTQTKPVVTAPVQTPVVEPTTQTVEPTGDILTRVTKKKEASKTPEDTAGTFKIFDDVTDPVQREKLIAREKERTADYTRKMQEVSRERATVQKQLDEMKTWTPEKIQQYCLNNPTFTSAAQQVASTQNPAGSNLTDEQFSQLTPGEKNQLSEMTRQLGELRQQNFIAAATQKDALLQTKYGDYDALKVNQTFTDFARMNPIDLKEHVYKSVFHDDHVKEAYELGKQEASTLNQTRAQASTPIGSQTLAADRRPVRDKRDTDIGYFQKLAQARIDEAKGLAAAKR